MRKKILLILPLLLFAITQQLQAQLVMQLDHLSSAVDWGPDARVRLA